jgi:acyl-coenzyme A synthetase/AMP-(fatty) acid ligase
MPDALAQKVTEVLGELTPQRLEIVKKLPRNSMGKLMRHKLVERFSNKPVQSG